MQHCSISATVNTVGKNTLILIPSLTLKRLIDGAGLDGAILVMLVQCIMMHNHLELNI